MIKVVKKILFERLSSLSDIQKVSSYIQENKDSLAICFNLDNKKPPFSYLFWFNLV